MRRPPADTTPTVSSVRRTAGRAPSAPERTGSRSRRGRATRPRRACSRSVCRRDLRPPASSVLRQGEEVGVEEPDAARAPSAGAVQLGRRGHDEAGGSETIARCVLRLPALRRMRRPQPARDLGQCAAVPALLSSTGTRTATPGRGTRTSPDCQFRATLSSNVSISSTFGGETRRSWPPSRRPGG